LGRLSERLIEYRDAILHYYRVRVVLPVRCFAQGQKPNTQKTYDFDFLTVHNKTLSNLFKERGL
jgi:hypothetical protein